MPLMDSVNNFQKHWLEQTFDDYDQTTLRKPRKRDYFRLPVPTGVLERFGITQWEPHRTRLIPTH